MLEASKDDGKFVNLVAISSATLKIPIAP